MKLTVLVDNNTIIDNYLIGEPGVCYLIETGPIKLLFDTGYSDVFIKNAQTLGFDLHALNTIVLSHGHNDHSWGIGHLAQFYDQSHRPAAPIKLITHPDACRPKQYDGLEIGAKFSAQEFSPWLETITSQTPYRIADDLIFLGEIPRANDFEGLHPVGCTVDHDGHTVDDFVRDDSALVCTTSKGIVVITGCSHSGICNILEYAKKVANDDRVVAVLGGFHLQNAKPEILARTSQYFEQLNAETLYPCHCTDLRAKIALDQVADIQEVGVGLVLDFAQ